MWLTDKPIAHRGLHDEMGCPENSLAAIRRAIRHGYPVEIDVRLTRDHAIVVFHDEDLHRLTGIRGRVRDLDYRELAGYRLLKTGEHIPLFDEVLSEVKGDIPILIEIKNDGRIGPLESILAEKLESYTGAHAVQSFNPLVLRWFRKNHGSMLRGQISCFFEDEKINFIKKAAHRMMLLNPFTEPDFIAYDVNRLPYWAVTRARTSGTPVLGWTVRSQAVQARVKPFVDNIIFEGYLP